MGIFLFCMKGQQRSTFDFLVVIDVFQELEVRPEDLYEGAANEDVLGRFDRIFYLDLKSNKALTFDPLP